MTTSDRDRVDDRLPRLLSRARATLGSDLWLASGRALALDGTAELLGASTVLRTLVAPDGRFVRRLDGTFVEHTGFDGERAWRVEDAGVPFELSLLLREVALLETWVHAGLWALRDGPFEVTRAGAGAVALRLPGGRIEGRLAVDPGTARPLELTWEASFGQGRVRYGPLTGDGPRVPESAAGVTDHGLAHGQNVTSVSTAPLAELAALASAPPRETGGRARFDAAAPAAVPVSKAPTGHFLVRPELDGRDAGWFVFDTGAAMSVVAPEVARRLGMQPAGRTSVVGAGDGMEEAPLSRGGALTLGPLTVHGVAWAESRIVATLDEVLGPEKAGQVVGILGWDVLIHAVAEMDLRDGELSLYDPATYCLPAGDWEPLVLHRKHPFVRARFEGGREGLFCFDSGAGDVTVMFHTPAVDALGLLDGRATQAVEALGAGGPLALEMGQLGWFEVAGHRVDDPPALFCRDVRGALADLHSTGNLGHAFFEPFRVVFDYPRARVGYVPRD